jgi:hypothetical protein
VRSLFSFSPANPDRFLGEHHNVHQFVEDSSGGACRGGGQGKKRIN